MSRFCTPYLGNESINNVFAKVKSSLEALCWELEKIHSPNEHVRDSVLVAAFKEGKIREAVEVEVDAILAHCTGNWDPYYANFPAVKNVGKRWFLNDGVMLRIRQFVDRLSK